MASVSRPYANTNRDEKGFLPSLAPQSNSQPQPGPAHTSNVSTRSGNPNIGGMKKGKSAAGGTAGGGDGGISAPPPPPAGAKPQSQPKPQPQPQQTNQQHQHSIVHRAGFKLLTQRSPIDRSITSYFRPPTQAPPFVSTALAVTQLQIHRDVLFRRQKQQVRQQCAEKNPAEQKIFFKILNSNSNSDNSLNKLSSFGNRGKNNKTTEQERTVYMRKGVLDGFRLLLSAGNSGDLTTWEKLPLGTSSGSTCAAAAGDKLETDHHDDGDDDQAKHHHQTTTTTTKPQHPRHHHHRRPLILTTTQSDPLDVVECVCNGQEVRHIVTSDLTYFKRLEFLDLGDNNTEIDNKKMKFDMYGGDMYEDTTEAAEDDEDDVYCYDHETQSLVKRHYDNDPLENETTDHLLKVNNSGINLLYLAPLLVVPNPHMNTGAANSTVAFPASENKSSPQSSQLSQSQKEPSSSVTGSAAADSVVTGQNNTAAGVTEGEEKNHDEQNDPQVGQEAQVDGATQKEGAPETTTGEEEAKNAEVEAEAKTRVISAAADVEGIGKSGKNDDKKDVDITTKSNDQKENENDTACRLSNSHSNELKLEDSDADQAADNNTSCYSQPGGGALRELHLHANGLSRLLLPPELVLRRDITNHGQFCLSNLHTLNLSYNFLGLNDLKALAWSSIATHTLARLDFSFNFPPLTQLLPAEEMAMFKVLTHLSLEGHELRSVNLAHLPSPPTPTTPPSPATAATGTTTTATTATKTPAKTAAATPAPGHSQTQSQQQHQRKTHPGPSKADTELQRQRQQDALLSLSALPSLSEVNLNSNNFTTIYMNHLQAYHQTTTMHSASVPHKKSDDGNEKVEKGEAAEDHKEKQQNFNSTSSSHSFFFPKLRVLGLADNRILYMEDVMSLVHLMITPNQGEGGVTGEEGGGAGGGGGGAGAAANAMTHPIPSFHTDRSLGKNALQRLMLYGNPLVEAPPTQNELNVLQQQFTTLRRVGMVNTDPKDAVLGPCATVGATSGNLGKIDRQHGVFAASSSLSARPGGGSLINQNRYKYSAASHTAAQWYPTRRRKKGTRFFRGVFPHQQLLQQQRRSLAQASTSASAEGFKDNAKQFYRNRFLRNLNCRNLITVGDFTNRLRRELAATQKKRKQRENTQKVEGDQEVENPVIEDDNDGPVEKGDTFLTEADPAFDAVTTAKSATPQPTNHTTKGCNPAGHNQNGTSTSKKNIYVRRRVLLQQQTAAATAKRQQQQQESSDVGRDQDALCALLRSEEGGDEQSMDMGDAAASAAAHDAVTQKKSYGGGE